MLLGLLVCYQIVNQIVLKMTLSREESELSDDFDGACAAAPGANGASSLCMEAQLFHGWHESPSQSHEDFDGLLAASPGKSAEAKPPLASSAALAGAPSVQDALANVKPQALEGALWDLAFSMGGGKGAHSTPQNQPTMPSSSMRGAAKAHDRSRKAKSPPKKPFAKSLKDLQHDLEAKMQSQARRHAEHRALIALHRVANHEPADAAAPDHDGLTTWAHNLDDLTHELQDHMKARHMARAKAWHEHGAARAAAHAIEAAHVAPSGAQQPAVLVGKSVLLDEVQALGQQLCQDPERHHLQICAQFVQSHAASPIAQTAEGRHQARNDRHALSMAHMKLLEKHIDELESEQAHDTEELQHKSEELLREMCADPPRSSYPACARLLATAKAAVPVAKASGFMAPAAASTTTTPASPKGLRGGSKKLLSLHWSEHMRISRWEAMKDQAAKSLGHVDRPQFIMQRRELLTHHWEGHIPKVACVTVLPQGHVTEQLMTYFMDNYRLQHYEGAQQLVIVYHSSDKEASRLAHLHADGTSVIAAAAQEAGGFPSATAYRYGAWLAKGSDLVARWDFDAWHHPNRLSMQVRAIVLAGRQASVVASITSFDADGKHSIIKGGTGAHGSMIGETSWMQKHWMPLLEEESSVVHGLQAHHLVQVDIPTLLAYHDTPASSSPAA